MSHRQFTHDNIVIWAYSTTAIHHPVGPILETTEIETVRIGIEMEPLSDGVTITPAFTLSDDGCDWDTPVEILPSGQGGPVVSRSSNGVSYDTQFRDIATITNGTNTKRYMRFGILAVHDTTDTLGICRASLHIDVRS